MDVPTEHLNLLKKSIIGFEFLVPCCGGKPLLLNFSLAIPPYSVVYDPTAFMACKLVIVAWLKAYGAATNRGLSVEQLPHVTLLGTRWYRGS